MNRTITIKGVGRLSLKPDQVAVTLCLKTTDPVYEEAMRAATAELAQLRAAIAPSVRDRRCVSYASSSFSSCVTR